MKKSLSKYQSTLNYLYTQLPMYQRMGKVAFKKDLDNILALVQELDQPQKKYPCIHIAGTNGKGSTAHILAAVLQEHGFKTGLYTSPHYKDFRERIKVDGKYVSRQYITNFVDQHKASFKKIQPSFFEITVAMAFDYFAHKKVDIAIIETGLGGRLDSTNIIHPLISVITNISLDHQAMLGDTLPLIAYEKAGIIKKEVPVIIGEEQKLTKPVFESRAREENAPLYLANRLFKVVLKKENLTHSFYDIFHKKEMVYENLKLNLHGPFQAKNLATAFQSLTILAEKFPEFKIKKNKLKKGLANLKDLTKYQGRWQILDQKPLIICDSAHNEGGLKIVLKQLKQIPCAQLHIVMGVVNDKSIDHILKLFPKKATYYFAKADIPRGLDATILMEKAEKFTLKGKPYSSVKNAFKMAKKAAKKNDLIFVGGSCFVVAEVI